MSSFHFSNSQQNRDRFSPLLERVDKLPSLQIKQRCQELKALFSQYNYKELKPIFPKVLNDIFSPTYTGWNLNLLQEARYNHWHDVSLRPNKENSLSDFQNVRLFLSPTGPLFDLIYKFQADPTIKFEFPTELLPGPTKDAFTQGVVAQFYLNKLSYLEPNTLQLSAFDVYMFHFAYFIVSLQTNKNQPGQNSCLIENSVYTCLVEDYLNFFLPLGGKRVPPMPYTGTSPSYNQSGASSNTRQYGGQQKQTSFLRNTTLQRSTSVCHGDNHLESIGQENWRSEVLIEVLVEFWLNQNSLHYDQTSFSQQVRANILPSEDLVRLIRMLLKHLHFFANSAKEVVHSAYHQVEEPLEDLKRHIIPLIVQNKLYTFLRHGFDRWPLDSSFRLILETWLSFIQPWRYMEHQNIHEDKDQPLSNSSKKFVADNLHFYTVLFQEYVQRALRHDLAAPKNAQMLFRVGKVFGQSDLHAVIEECECRSSPNGIPASRMSTTQLMASGSFISLSPSSSTTSILQQVMEMEGPTFRYKPLFGFECRQMMEQLFKCISQARAMLHSPPNSNSKPRTGFFAWLSSLAVDDYDSVNRERIDLHLSHSEAFFAKIFQIEAVSHNSSMTWETPTRGSDHQAPDMSGGKLTPLGRYQVANGLRKLKVTYNGNPDLQPIRTFENKRLVRLLHTLSTWINDHFGEEINDLCLSEGFIGSIAYQYFQPPYQETSLNDETFLSVNHSRICLRFMASYRSIFYLLVFLLALYFMNFSFFGAVFVLFLILIMYGIVGGCVHSLSKQQQHVD